MNDAGPPDDWGGDEISQAFARVGVGTWTDDERELRAQTIEATPARRGPYDPIRGDLLSTRPSDPPQIIGLFQLDAINALYGEAGTGKSIIAGYAAVDQLHQGHRVLWIDYEMGEARTRRRLEMLGASCGELERLFYLHMMPKVDHPERLAGIVEDCDPRIVILDALSGSLAAEGLEADKSNTDIALWEIRYAMPLISRGAGLIALDHMAKSKERGRFAIGAQRKLGMITGTAVFVSGTPLIAAGRPGTITLVCAKSRDGHWAPGTAAASVHVDGDHDAIRVVVTIRHHDDPDVAAQNGNGYFRPTYLMERVSRYLESFAPEGLNQSAVEKGVEGKANGIRSALRALVAEGLVLEKRVGAQVVVYSSVAAYRESEDPKSDRYKPSPESDEFF